MQLQNKLQKRIQEGTLRTLRVAPAGAVDLCSNDYLGFARSAKWADLTHQIIGQHTLAHGAIPTIYGATGSRLLNGNSAYAESFEQYLANFYDAPAALLFNSGYDANLGFYSAVPSRHDLVLYDEYAHASIRDGLRMGEAKAVKFKHNNVAHLHALLQQFAPTGKYESVFVAVESIYSMDGDCAPLVAMAALCEQYRAHLVVDEAHATGLFGKQGRGLVDELNIATAVFARLHTFGKALGAHGAAIVGSAELKSFLINFARPLIYSTALPISTLAQVHAAHEMLLTDQVPVAALHTLVQHFKKLQEKHVFRNAQWIPSSSPIQCLVIGNVDVVKAAAAALAHKMLDVRPIYSPTVAVQTERLRVCLHAFNTIEQLHLFFETLQTIL